MTGCPAILFVSVLRTRVFWLLRRTRVVRAAFGFEAGRETVVEAVPVRQRAWAVVVNVHLSGREVARAEGHRLLVEVAEDRLALHREGAANERAPRVATRVHVHLACEGADRHQVAVLIDVQAAVRGVLVTRCGYA